MYITTNWSFGELIRGSRGSGDPDFPPDQVSSAAARNHPNTRAGGQDDVSSQANSLKLAAWAVDRDFVHVWDALARLPMAWFGPLWHDLELFGLSLPVKESELWRLDKLKEFACELTSS